MSPSRDAGAAGSTHAAAVTGASADGFGNSGGGDVDVTTGRVAALDSADESGDGVGEGPHPPTGSPISATPMT